MLEGIDVSSYQGTVNWEQVVRAGKSFAFVKATEGLYYQDPTFNFNWSGTKAWGMIRGAYHYFRPVEDGAVQADYLHAYVRANGHFAYMDFAVCDIEQTDGLSADQVIARVVQFIQQAKASIYKQVILYTYPSFWIDTLGNPVNDVIAQCPLWLADYGPSVPALANWPNGLSFWQYSSSGHCPGVPVSTDLNRYYGSWQSLLQLARYP